MPPNSRRYETVGNLIAVANRMATEVDHKQVRDLVLQQGLTFQEAARALVLSTCSEKLAQMVIARVVRLLVAEGEYAAIQRRNRERGGERGGNAIMPEGFDRSAVATEKAKSGWDTDELDRLRDLVEGKECLYTAGRAIDTPCFPLIAQVLNKEFCSRRPPRTGNSCLRRYKRLCSENESIE